MRFTCAFADNYSTDEAVNVPKYTVNTPEILLNTIAMEQQIKWDDFSLKFFSDEDFESTITSDIEIGSTLYMEAKWENDFEDDFPVQFFVKECRVTDGEHVFKVKVFQDKMLNNLLQFVKSKHTFFILF